MTTKDKTGDRLVASIRRTRAGAEKPIEETSQQSAMPRKATAPAKEGAASPEKKRAAKQPGGAKGKYQSAGRVWPD